MVVILVPAAGRASVAGANIVTILTQYCRFYEDLKHFTICADRGWSAWSRIKESPVHSYQRAQAQPYQLNFEISNFQSPQSCVVTCCCSSLGEPGRFDKEDLGFRGAVYNCDGSTRFHKCMMPGCVPVQPVLVRYNRFWACCGDVAHC